jgi:hypothetical protein
VDVTITWKNIDPRTDRIEVLDQLSDYLERLNGDAGDRADITITAHED